MTEENKNENVEMVPKTELADLQGKLDKAAKDAEDVKSEIFTPEYMEFLDSRDKHKDDKTTEEKPVLDDKAFEGKTPKEIFEMAKKAASEEIGEKLTKVQLDRKAEKEEATQKEIARFSRTHEDFETYRPVMYGLSLDKKNADLSLAELYDRAKKHIGEIHKETTEAEKKQQQKLAGEKPGGSGENYERLVKLSADDAATEAAAETREKLGSMPTA